jgi:FKBP-type peptidyl-prolyl cis-trans isomerase SlpA
MDFPMAAVSPGSHVTLHYRLAVGEDSREREVFSTPDGHPATLLIGGGHLAPALEQCLIGLQEGVSADFDFPADQAFGARIPALVQALARTVVERNVEPGTTFDYGDVVEVKGPDGARVAGVVRQQDAERVVIDFNHPLAGLPMRFSVQIIGVL